MDQLKNYYELLGIERFADAETVKSTYRKLARQYHPDLNAGNKSAEEKFKEINEAYEVLSNPDKRGPYDQSLRILLKKPNPAPSKGDAKSAKGKESTKTAPSPKAPPPASEKDGPHSSTPIGDLFESFKKNFQAGSTPGNTAKKSAQAPQGRTRGTDQRVFRTEKKAKRGEDVTVEALITPMEAEQGVIKTVNVQHNELCRRCAGTGRVNGLLCSGCQGEKVFSRLKKIDVRIPAGVKQGSKVRIAGEGGRGLEGAENGDLFLLIRIQLDASLRMEGLNVYCELPISVLEAVLGTELEVPTLTGTVKMAVPPLTSSGKVFRLREQGAQNGQSRGDQFVTVQIHAPEALSAREKELYEELARLGKKKP